MRTSSPESRSRCGCVALLAVLALLWGATSAGADVGETIILRCTHRQSLAGFSQSAYARALKELSADTEEYTECSQLIRAAQAAAARGGGGSTGAGGAGAAAPVAAIAATPTEQRAITRAGAAARPVSLGGQVIRPGVIHAGIASAFSALPTPLLIMLLFLLASLMLVIAGNVRDRVRDRRAD